MLLEFKTSNRNTYGRRKYLAIDTEAGIYSTTPSRMIVDGIEVKTADYKELIEKCKRLEFKEVEKAF